MSEPPRVPAPGSGPAPQTVRIEIAKPGPEPKAEQGGVAKADEHLAAALAENTALRERLATEESGRREAELSLKRFQRGVDAGLPPKLAARLRGETDEEIDADIADLLPESAQRTSPAPNPHQGRWAGQPTPSLAAGREKFHLKHTEGRSA